MKDKKVNNDHVDGCACYSCDKINGLLKELRKYNSKFYVREHRSANYILSCLLHDNMETTVGISLSALKEKDALNIALYANDTFHSINQQIILGKCWDRL